MRKLLAAPILLLALLLYAMSGGLFSLFNIIMGDKYDADLHNEMH